MNSITEKKSEQGELSINTDRQREKERETIKTQIEKARETKIQRELKREGAKAREIMKTLREKARETQIDRWKELGLHNIDLTQASNDAIL